MNNLTVVGLTIQTWYMSINRPFWAPPVWLFGVAWGIIYPLIVASFGYAFYKSFVKHKWRRYIGALFALNLTANIIYALGTYFVFSSNQSLNDVAQYYWPATVVLLTVLATLPVMMVITWERARWVAIAQIPYLAWILLATTLQLAINFAN